MRQGGYMNICRSERFSARQEKAVFKAFAKESHLGIIDEFGLVDEKEMERVKFYSAVGTAADFLYALTGDAEDF